jgi:putative transposase
VIDIVDGSAVFSHMPRPKHYDPGGRLCFITSVTYKRKPLLGANADLLINVLNEFQRRTGCMILAWVIMPDHFHIIVDVKENDMTSLIQRIKMSFGALLRKRLCAHAGRIWHNGFWDHVIQDDRDMKKHMDYIHFNPVKHGHVVSPHDWPNSSIHNYRDDYPPDWGETGFNYSDGEYGE